jgi:hypothetical protein
MRAKRTSAAVVVMVAIAVLLPLYAGKFNTVIDIGAPLPEFSNLPSGLDSWILRGKR